MKCQSCDVRLTVENVSQESSDTCAGCAKHYRWEAIKVALTPRPTRPSKPDTVTYLLRDIPQALHAAAKAKAAQEGVSLRVVLLRLLRGYARR